MNLDHFLVYKSPYEKIRLGKNNDGGYIICDIPNINYDIFLSGGIETDISFEEDFLTKYPNILECIAFDGSISNLPHHNPKIHHIKKHLGYYDSLNTSTLNEYFEKYNNIFLKLDIEGGEEDLFQSISDNNLKKIKQLVIEFHNSNEEEIPKRLAKTHWLIHFHPNNSVSLGYNGVPNIFECTYILKSNDDQLKYNTDPIPNPLLDMPNSLHNSDIILSGYPFIHLS